MIRIRTLVVLAIVLGALMAAIGCVTSPTGRTQVLLNSEYEMAEMGRVAFVDIQSNTPKSTNADQIGYVRCVANAITATLTSGELRPIAVDRWEVELFEDPTANAFALPGGKMGVHTGLLAVATTPAQLATVLGHEVGHVVSRHGNERVTQQMIAAGGVEALQIVLGGDSPEKKKLYGAIGAGAAQFGFLLPFGRAQESEADEFGLELMARAGFDPRESVSLWRNMARASGGRAPIEFMSTHPSYTTRIRRLEQGLPRAILIYDRTVSAGNRMHCR